MGTKYI